MGYFILSCSTSVLYKSPSLCKCACAAAKQSWPWNNTGCPVAASSSPELLSVILRPVFLPGPGLSSLVRPLSSSGFPSYSTNKPEPKHKRRQLSQKESSKPLDVPRGQGNFKEASLQGSFQNIPFFLAPLVPTVLWRSREAFLVLPGSLKGGDRCFECVEGDIISLKDSN